MRETKEKFEVDVVVIRGERYIKADDVAQLVFHHALAMNCADDRQMTKQLAENIAAGKVR